MDPHSDRASAVTYADARFGTTGYPDAAPSVLAWVMDTMAGPLVDPDAVGTKPVVVLHGDHHRLVRDVVWGRELLPFDQFYDTVPPYAVGPYRWSVADAVHSWSANDLVEVRIIPHGATRHESVCTRHVDWATDGAMHQDLYDHFRHAGAAPAEARTLAAASAAAHQTGPGDTIAA